MIYTLGSINADFFYSVPHLPGEGETLAADHLSRALGGKGANQSLAAARAGADVLHMGAVGPDGGWVIAALAAAGIDTSAVEQTDTPTGHAIICVDRAGQNQIILYPGANRQIPSAALAPLSRARRGDWLLLQNETNLQPEAARKARDRGARVAYSAAPFDAKAVRAVLPWTDLLLLNAVEARQLADEMAVPVTSLPVARIVITRGAEGADWHDTQTGQRLHVPAWPTDVIDTTGAGDTFAGFLVAALSRSMKPGAALRLAASAAAIQVSRPGASTAIPTLAEATQFCQRQP